MRVAKVRRATDEEVPDHWTRANPVCLEMQDGSVVIPARDPELNGPGYLLEVDQDGNYFGFEPEEGA